VLARNTGVACGVERAVTAGVAAVERVGVVWAPDGRTTAVGVRPVSAVWLSTLRGLAVAVGCATMGARTGGGLPAGWPRGAAGFSAICGPLNGDGVGGSGVDDGSRVAVAVGTAAVGAAASSAVGSASGVGSDRRCAASACSSASTRCTNMALPSPSMYPAHASKNTIAANA
jgi:hypothetical protein